MADNDPRSLGRRGPVGRGALLDLLKKRNANLDIPSAAPSPRPTPNGTASVPNRITSVPDGTASVPNGTASVSNGTVPSLGRGRASLLKLIQELPESLPTGSTESASLQSLQSRGRASLLNLINKHNRHPGDSISSAPSSSRFTLEPSRDAPRGNGFGKSAPKTSQSVTSTEPISRQGTTGDRVQLHANYIRLKVEPGRGVFEYEVEYSPDLESRQLRSKLLSQHAQAFGDARVFDGTTLALPYALEKPRMELRSQHPMDGSVVRLTIIYKRQRRLGEVVSLYNNLFRRIMHALDLVQIGRQHFNSRAAYSIPQHRLELWPGYVTAIDEYEGGLQLCLETTHRVLRTETVRDLMNIVLRKREAWNARDLITKEIIGVSVLTRYNNRIYRIEDIDWNSTPLKTFTLKNDPANELTLLDYYKKHWNIKIQDKNQPLLVYRTKERLPSGEQIEETKYLIPELCYLAGLTEPMRKDFELMKDVADVTRVTPEYRVNGAQRFIQEVKKNQLAVQLLASWGLTLDDSIVALQGRVLPPENIFFGEGQMFKGQPNAEWNRAVCSTPVLSTPGLENWCLLFCKRDYRKANDFHEMILKVGKPMGMSISPAKLIELKDDGIGSCLAELKENISPRMQIMVIIFPSNRTDKYAAVKKLCCVQMPIASQVIISSTMNNPNKLKSITQKIALQMNCKLGGTLWALKIPLANGMVCGVDIHHAGSQRSRHGSVAGFVASLDKRFTRWFSKVCLQGPNQELMNSLKICFVAALKTYYKFNQCFPDRIIMYRDGVGDGQLETVRNFEVKQLEESFAVIAPDYKPRLTVVIVQKRINTRIFLKAERVENPPPGTVVDEMVTRRDYYDFFLVSQNVRRGTVSPTHYLVIHDEVALEPDQLQRLTYKLCHMYYNWPGTVRVPAPCQYAHKLALQVGQSIQMEPHESLSTKFYYL